MHVPGWHEKTHELQAAGRVRMVGIIEEQHPDRTRLFMQWKKIGWPILADPLGLLEVEVVPITVFVDEAGIVRRVGAKPEDLPAFLESNPGAGGIQSFDVPERSTGETAGLMDRADSAFLWGGEPGIDRAIDLYSEILSIDPEDGRARFRLGVALRARHDSRARQAGDFSRAVEQWGAALEIEPNQYIWRRRIQQYGPRLSKPYPFYDWIGEAEESIRSRGEEPVALDVRPTGAEIASPAETIGSTASGEEPDPGGRIVRDTAGMIRIESTVVPARIEPGEPARVHIAMKPDVDLRAHWNNEAEEPVVWIDPPAGWTVDARRHTVPLPRRPVSLETRRVELEVISPSDFAGPALLSGYALYYVCEKADGTCLYRRQDLSIPLESRSRRASP